MELTGRLVADAAVKTLKDKRQVLTFTVVENNNYVTKGGEKRQQATYFNCSYWISTKIAEQLKKGAIVTVHGHVGINAYKGMDNEYHAQLVYHANNIKIVSFGGKGKPSLEPADTGNTNDDLPF